MSGGTLPNRADASSGKKIASVCVAPAHAELQTPTNDPMFEYVSAVQREFKKNDQEMSHLLGIAQSNYSRRSYNIARVQRLPDTMRQSFVHKFARGEGLRVETATLDEQIKTAAKLAIINLLELLETKNQ